MPNATDDIQEAGTIVKNLLTVLSRVTTLPDGQQQVKELWQYYLRKAEDLALVTQGLIKGAHNAVVKTNATQRLDLRGNKLHDNITHAMSAYEIIWAVTNAILSITLMMVLVTHFFRGNWKKKNNGGQARTVCSTDEERDQLMTAQQKIEAAQQRLRYTEAIDNMLNLSTELTRQSTEREKLTQEVTELESRNHDLKVKLDQAKRDVYALSLVPIIAEHNSDEKPITKIRNMIFNTFDLPEPRKGVIEDALGVIVPPDWILTKERASLFLASFFPGLETTTYWKTQLGANTEGCGLFKELLDREAIKEQSAIEKPGFNSFGTPHATRRTYSSGQTRLFQSPKRPGLKLIGDVAGRVHADIHQVRASSSSNGGPPSLTSSHDQQEKGEHIDRVEVVNENEDLRITSINQNYHQETDDENLKRIALTEWHVRCKDEHTRAVPPLDSEVSSEWTSDSEVSRARSTTSEGSVSRTDMSSEVMTDLGMGHSSLTGASAPLRVYGDTKLRAKQETEVILITENGSKVANRVIIGLMRELPAGLRQIYSQKASWVQEGFPLRQHGFQYRRNESGNIRQLTKSEPYFTYSVLIRNDLETDVIIQGGECYHHAHELSSEKGEVTKQQRRQESTIATMGWFASYVPDVDEEHPLWALGNRQMLKGNIFPSWNFHPRPSVPTVNQPLDLEGKTRLLKGNSREFLLEMLPSSLEDYEGIITGTPLLSPADREARKQLKEAKPYLFTVLTTDQCVSCETIHHNCKVCCMCMRWTICWRKGCGICNSALKYELANIIDRECLDYYNVETLRDVIYHHLLCGEAFPAGREVRFPIHRINNWDLQATLNQGSNPYYNKILPCIQCHESHRVACRKKAEMYFLPHENSYYTMVKARKNKVIPYMMYGYLNEGKMLNREESIKDCPEKPTMAPIGEEGEILPSDDYIDNKELVDSFFTHPLGPLLGDQQG